MTHRCNIIGLALSLLTLVTVGGCPTIVIRTADLPTAVEGRGYSELLASDSDRATAWTLIWGDLPAGLVLDEDTGRISGTPREHGEFTFGVRASSANRRSGESALTLNVIEELTLDPNLPEARDGEAFVGTLGAAGGVPPYEYEIAGLPAGLSLDDDSGVISGTPPLGASATRENTLRVTVTDSGNGGLQQSLTVNVELVILTQAIEITSAERLAAAQIDAPYETTLAVSGGRAPYTWTIVDGNLVPTEAEAIATELELDPNGTISGVPTVLGERQFVVKVVDSETPATEDIRLFTLPVTADGVDPNAAQDPNALQLAVQLNTTPVRAQTAFSATLTASGGTAPYEYDFVGGTLPEGLTVDPNSGDVSGQPTTAENDVMIEFLVSDAVGDIATVELTIDILPALVEITTAARLADGTVGANYIAAIEAENGVAPYTWTLVAGEGDLPDGLFFDTGNQQVYGTPEAAGTSTFTIKVTDSSTPPQSDEKPFTLVVTE